MRNDMIVICESIILRKVKSLTMVLWLKKERKKSWRAPDV